MNSESNLGKYQRLLRDMFQFDCADLDFGIYRIMNYKRDVIERFITKDLPKAIATELDKGALAEQSRATKELKELEQQIRGVDAHAIDVDGNLADDIKKLDIGKKYLGLKEKTAGGSGREALEAAIFNHLYTFFSRYYQDGDFISKRRYSKRQKYAIPYNGEEVYLYWANNDQYYIKTAEHFHDYTFTSHGVTVHFKLTSASVEQDNIKGDRRFFLPRCKELDWDENADRLIIPFECRPLTEQEQISYGKKNQQEAIITKALEEIPKQLGKNVNALRALTVERRKTGKGESVSYLEHHLRQFTRRNTSDFFIHKDLKGFLSRELDFYLKNEVLNLDEMEAAGEGRAEGWFQLMRVIKTIGSRIIDFLAQIENFQKMLWEKRKFITETQYCITVGNIAEGFYPEITVCEQQWAEWKDLFHIDEEQTDLFTNGKRKKGKRTAFLKAHPTLVMDTKHFHLDFKDKLLASFEHLDEQTDGLLIHSENFQALNVLLEKYREKVKCIYIDPPYNTGNDEFIYRDNYQHSSWLSMIQDRLYMGNRTLSEDGLLFISIDDIEQHKLRALIDSLVGPDKLIGQFVWKSRQNKDNRNITGASIDHEYVFAYGQRIRGEPRKKEQYRNPDNDPRGPWVSANMVGILPEAQRPNCHYDLIDPETGINYRKPKLGWRYDKDTMNRLVTEKRIIWPSSPDGRPRRKAFLSELKSEFTGYSSLIASGIYTRDGTSEIDALFSRRVIGFPKPTGLVRKLVQQVGDVQCVVMDYFAGSGTTAHAVINLNREDSSKRKFILVEIGEYFDTILLPRIKKITFTPEWKDGKPKRMATAEEAERSPRIVKYIRLEGYEDALNNIEFDEASGQQALKFDDYLLKYMLRWETRKSETLLNVEKLASPFRYTLHIHEGGQTREKVVDIPETFNYLLGLHVTRRLVIHDGDRRYLVYRGRIDHREIAVIWRETEGWMKEDLERDKKFVAEQKLTEGADEVFVNGDSFIPKAKALEPVFKARMFAPVEA